MRSTLKIDAPFYRVFSFLETKTASCLRSIIPRRQAQSHRLARANPRNRSRKMNCPPHRLRDRKSVRLRAVRRLLSSPYNLTRRVCPQSDLTAKNAKAAQKLGSGLECSLFLAIIGKIALAVRGVFCVSKRRYAYP